MKKKNIFITTLLLSSQFLMPISSFAEDLTSPQINRASEYNTLASDKYYTWGNLSFTLNQEGVLTIPGGELKVNSPTLSKVLALDSSLVKKIIISDTLKLSGDVSGLFSGLNNLETITNANLIDVSSVTNLDSFFSLNAKLKQLDLSSWNTSSVNSMRNLFMYCSSIETLDLSQWDTSSVINMNNTFNNMSNLTSLSISNWNVSSVTDMHGTFMSNYKLNSLDVSSWNTQNVLDMSDLFAGTGIENLDLSNWDVSKVTDMKEMFTHSSLLEELNISKWAINNNVIMGDMFGNTTSLKILHLSKNFKFKTGANLPEHSSNSIYTSNWQNVSTGSIYQPNGGNIWSSSELMNNYQGDGDIYVWQPKSVVTVQYQDTEGNSIAPNVAKAGNVGETYTSEKLTIDGYTFKEIKGAASGTFTTEPQTVTYVYTKDPVKGAEVTVQYQDTEGNSIAPNVIKAGNVGEAYTSEELAIEGYTFKEIKGTASGTFTAEPQTVTYVYTKDPVKGAEVTVQYQDTEGNSIAPNVIKAGNVGEAYTSEELAIEGYTFKEIKGTASGTFTAEPQTVTYVYTKDPVKGAEVTVQYQDTEGNSIAPNVIKAGNVGEAYTSEKLTIEGYTFKEIKGTASGTFTAEPQTVTYVYTKDPVKGAEVTVQYQDTEGNTIAPNVIKAGNVGEAYTSEELAIEGYTFKEIKGTASGTFTAEPQTVTYVYTKDPVKGAEVTVQYQDTEGNTIVPNVIKAGNVGEAYTSEELAIEGYTFKEIKGTASGTFTAEPQTVTYVYTKDPVKGAEVTVQYQDTEGNSIAPNVIKAGNVGEAYTSEKLTIEGYTFKEIKGAASGTFTTEPQTVTYVYTKNPVKGAEVTVQYQDTEGNSIAPNVIKAGNVGEAYTSEELAIEGYTFKEIKGTASGTFTAEPQTVTYIYTNKKTYPVNPTDSNLLKIMPINSKSAVRTLPQTGESKTILLTILGGGILIIGVFMIYGKFKIKKK
ncbi:MucBP domain-containing protein [Enterococcus alishanensis]